MDIYLAFDELKKEFEAISYQERKTREIFKKIFENNSAAINLTKSADSDKFFGSTHFMGFHRADNNEIVRYGKVRLPHEEMGLLLIKQRNRQYQWLLAEAHEAYEDFIKKISAIVGSKDSSLWNAAQSRKINNASDYLCCIAIIRRNPSEFSYTKLLSSLRNKFSAINCLEVKNALKCNLRFYLSLIEQLRHHIVHTKGLIIDTQAFIDKVIGISGLKKNDELENRVRLYLNDSEGNMFVSLSDRPTRNDNNLEQYHNVIDHLIQMFLSHALIVFEAIEYQNVSNKS